LWATDGPLPVEAILQHKGLHLRYAAIRSGRTVDRPLRDIATDIYRDWKPAGRVPGAKHIAAMANADQLSDHVNGVPLDEIVRAFLGQPVRNWRGATARRIKAELNGMLERHNSDGRLDANRDGQRTA
jgi:hypothetical protein